MQYIKALVLFITLYLFAGKAHSAVFVVTSNADAGSGTLREALTLAAANGILAEDYIQFNLPGNSEADRTILLQSELPLITSHLVLDGTTQPGPNLSNSPAKIMIRPNRPIYQSSQYSYGCFNILNVSNIQIYGFAFDQFSNIQSKTNPGGQASDASGIYMVSGSDITVGAPGKGNVFITNDIGVRISANDQYQNKNDRIKIQSNWFGLNLDGSNSETHKLYHVTLVAKDFEFGGPDITYGNIVGGYSAWGLAFGGNNGKVRFNRFGFIGDGTLSIYVIKVSLGIIDGDFTDNKAARFWVYVGGKNLRILRNRDSSTSIRHYAAGIELSYAENIQIGNDDIADVNEFLETDNYGVIRNFGSKNIEVRKNIIHCTPFAYGIRDGVPVSITVQVNNDVEYSGIATPNSEVYIYNDNTDCTSCSPLQFYTKLTADATTGRWGITGDFTNNKFIANTTLNNTSSEYTQPQILTGDSGYSYISKHPSCGESNGVLGLSKTANLLKVEWYNAKDEKVGEGTQVVNLPAGEYYAKGYNGKCYTRSDNMTLFNVEPEFVDTNLKVQQPSCGQKNGSIRGLFYTLFSGTASIKWVDENNQTITTGNSELINVGPGSYTLFVTVQNCIKSYGPIHLKNTDGPNIDRTKTIYKNASCDNSDGSITGVIATGTGNLKFTWKDEKETIVGRTADLINVKSGKYTLEVKDGSTCSITSGAFDIYSDNAITIDDSPLNIKGSSCSVSNGSISGITVTGATNYSWVDESGHTVASTLELKNVQQGRYKLRVSNSFCTKETTFFTVPALPAKIFTVTISNTTQASCGMSNGSIDVAASGDQPKTYKWTNASGNILSTSSGLSNAPAGSYSLYLADDNGCENFYHEYTIADTPPLQPDQSSVSMKNDRCNLKEAAISGIKLSGGKLPYSYQWTDAAGEVIGSNLDIQNIGSGTYQLQISDATSCNTLNLPFILQNIESEPPPPLVPSSQLCAAGKVKLQVSNPVPGKYILYDGERTQILAESGSGSFETNVSKSSDYYVSYRLGDCESSQTKVHITVGITSEQIPNKISPNGDGINDQWLIEGLQYYPNADVKIFSRSGTVVYQSKGYLRPFDGTQNGSPLPVGPYYYTIDFGAACNKLSGNLNLLR